MRESKCNNAAMGCHDYGGNWPEDYTHENGNYVNKCCRCENYFIGYKRRVVCKLCVEMKLKLAEL